MRYLQTESFFNKNINRYGCLFFSLMDIAEEYTGKLFSHKMIIELYYHLISENHMREDCWIESHPAVIAEAVFFLSEELVNVKYRGAWYHPNYDKRTSWGRLSGAYQIIQFFTPGSGHFRRTHYDPYRPLIKTTGIMSERYYDIEAA